LTISEEQLKYAEARIAKANLKGTIRLVLIDYRDMTVEKFGQFDKISNFEMSEHVGIRNYQTYMT